MQLHILSSAAACGQAAATLIAAQVLQKPDSVLGLATGSTPIPTYQHLIAMNQQGIVDFSSVRSYNLDEYVGVNDDHPCSYHYFMNEQLFSHVNIKKENTHVPSGMVADLVKEGRDYDAAIANAGGIDLQLLGIGQNGHIGFNEPDEHFTYECHTVTLTDSTIEANRRFFGSADAVPKQAISIGVGSIMHAKMIVLIATGKEKADAIYASVHGNVTPRVPASLLRTHPNVILLLDKDAASLL